MSAQTRDQELEKAGQAAIPVPLGSRRRGAYNEFPPDYQPTV
jgi:hypothetical protein